MLAFEISHCQHGTPTGHIYSLGIATENVHTAHDVISWDHQKGHLAKYDIYGLEIVDIKALGQALIQEALRIELEEKCKQ